MISVSIDSVITGIVAGGVSAIGSYIINKTFLQHTEKILEKIKSLLRKKR